MIRKKNPSQRVPCQRDNCCGVSNDHENYISITSRQNTRSHSKKKAKRAKKKDALKQILQQSYEQLKQQNQQLMKKLGAKKKKIEELKSKLKEYEQELVKCREINGRSQEQGRRGNNSSGEKKFTKMMQDSQAVAKQTLQRYKNLEEEYNKYREGAEKKIDKLRTEKQKLISEGAEKTYSHQIEELKNELHRFKQEQITASSLKNLNHHSKISQEEKLRMEISTLKATVNTLKSENNQMKQYAKEVEEELKERTEAWHHKEHELKNNLDAIHNKIENWEKEYRAIKEESMNWENEYNELLRKYQRKKQRQRANNSEWASIFRQFIQEIDKLKQELDAVSERNAKLIKMYGHQ